MPKAQQLSFDDFAAPAPVRTASPVSQEPQGASTAERSSSEGSEGDRASGSTAARSVSQQEVGGSVQVQPARELANDSSPQPQPARKNVSAQGLTDVQARAQEAGKAEMSAEQIVSQANKLCPGGHKLCEYTTPHGEHSCDVCKLPVAGQQLLLRCDECDYDVCCICAAPTKVPTGSPTELLTDTPTDLADRQADGERTGTSNGLRHVDAREQEKQEATTDECDCYVYCICGRWRPQPQELKKLQEIQAQKAWWEHRQHNSGSLPGVATLPDLQLPPLHPGFHEDGRPRSYVEASDEWNRQLKAHFDNIAGMIAVGQADGERTGA